MSYFSLMYFVIIKKNISKNSNQYDREVFTMILIFIFSKIYNNSIVNSKTIESLLFLTISLLFVKPLCLLKHLLKHHFQQLYQHLLECL